MDEPLDLRPLLPPIGQPVSGSLWACARPGRSLGPDAFVPDSHVRAWVQGIPGTTPKHLVSLLGEKLDGQSEYAFYRFRGSHEPDDGRPPFQVYLDRLAGAGSFVLHEFPTVDRRRISLPRLAEIAVQIGDLVREGHTVILFDSGGVVRVRQVRQQLGFRES